MRLIRDPRSDCYGYGLYGAPETQDREGQSVQQSVFELLQVRSSSQFPNDRRGHTARHTDLTAGRVGAHRGLQL